MNTIPVTSLQPWTFKARAVSDWGYVFGSFEYATEAEARKVFAEHKAHATEHGGAGSLHHNHEQVDRFSIWCPND